MSPLPVDHCSICALPYAREAGLSSRCQECLTDVPAFERLYATGLFEGPLMEAVYRFKYEGGVSLDRPLAELMVDCLPKDMAERIDALVPVPLESSRLKSRLYNQSDLLARHLSRTLQIPVLRCLERKAGGRPQQGLTRKERIANVKKAFSCSQPVNHARLLLVDDVCTTGATLRCCADQLKQAGAQSLEAVVLARADRRLSPQQEVQR